MISFCLLFSDEFTRTVKNESFHVWQTSGGYSSPQKEESYISGKVCKAGYDCMKALKYIHAVA
jgi:hypothetical protein